MKYLTKNYIIKTIKTIKTINLFFVSCMIVAVQVVPQTNSYVSAAGNSIYFDSDTVSINEGGHVTISIRATAPSFNAAQMDIVYDPHSVSYVNHSTAGSVLSNNGPYSQSSGSVRITLYSLTAVSGSDLFLASFTFKALRGAGSSTISLASSSAIVDAGSKVDATLGVCTISFTTPTTPSTPSDPTTPIVPPTPPTPSASPATVTQTTPKPPTTVNAPAQQPLATPVPKTETAAPTTAEPITDKTPPKIISVVPSGYVGGVINIQVTTDEPTKSIIKLGASKDNLTQSARVESFARIYFVPLGDIGVIFDKDTPYVYVVEAFDAAGNMTSSGIKQLVTSPVSLRILLKDSSGAPYSNTKTLINGKDFTSDREGYVYVNGVLPGLVTVSIVKNNTEEHLGDITAVEGAQDQSFEVRPGKVAGIATSKYSIPAPISAVLFIALLFCLVLGFAIIKRGKRRFVANGTDNYDAAATQRPVDASTVPTPHSIITATQMTENEYTLNNSSDTTQNVPTDNSDNNR